jgi:iron complex outermembrane receptor protein
VRGEDEERGVPLPEIPPLELRLALSRSFGGRVSGRVELGGRYVARAERIDPDFPESETPGFTVWHLRARFGLTRALSLAAGVENLLDRQYVEHLTREAAGNVPGLDPGQEIPQPGRYLTAALLLDF